MMRVLKRLPQRGWWHRVFQRDRVAIAESTASELVAGADTVSVAEADAVSDAEAVRSSEVSKVPFTQYEAEKGSKSGDATGTGS